MTTICCRLLSARLSTICHSFDLPIGGGAVGCGKRYVSDKKKEEEEEEEEALCNWNVEHMLIRLIG
jgi:hypothetical protein